MLLLATQTLLAASLTIGSQSVTHLELDNGMDLLWIDDGVDRVDLYTVYAAGSYMDTKPDLAHMTEHAMFCTKEGAFDEILKPYVEETNAYTRGEHTAYFTTAISLDNFETVLAREFARQQQLEVDQACFDYELGRLRKEVSDNHTLLADWDVDRRELLFHDSYAGRPSSSDEITIDDVQRFYDHWYQPNRAALVVVGSIGEQRWEQIVKMFGSLENRSDVSIELSSFKAANATLEYALSKERLEWVWRGPSIDQEAEWLYWTLLAKAHEFQRGSSGLGLSFSGGMRGSFIEMSVSGKKNEDQIADLYQNIQQGDIDEALFSEAKRFFSAHLEGLPIRGRPYFTLASDLGYWASWNKLGTLMALMQEEAPAAVSQPSAKSLGYIDASNRIVIHYPKGNVGDLPSDAKALGEAAQLAQNSGDLSRAIACYNKLLEMKPDKINSVIYHYYLAHLHLESGDKALAKDHLQQGLDIVEYPALREMLNEIDRYVPHERDESYVATADVQLTFAGDPPHWAEQALETMAQIERWRGLKFTQDVVVDFQEDAGYNASGWYDYESKRLVVGKEGSQRYIEGVMLHELYHALQDQHFDLGALDQRMQSEDQRAAMQAVIEGEAMLAVAELMNYDFLSHVNYTADLTEQQFTTMFNYGEGMKFIKSIRSGGGWDSVNQLYENPPSGSAVILDASKYQKTSSEAIDQNQVPTLNRGEKLLDVSEKGGVGWMFFLVQYAPSSVEVLAPLFVEDQVVVYQKKRQTKTRWRVGFASSEVAQKVASDLQPSEADVTVDGRWLILEVPK